LPLISTLKKAWFIQSSKERLEASMLFFLMLIGMFLECLGIGIILPLLSLVLDESIITKYPLIANFVSFIGSPSYTNLIFILFGSLLVMFLIKNLFLLYLSWRQSTFAYSVIANLSTRLLETYLKQPYSFHLTRNSGNLIRNTLSEVGLYGFNFLIPGLNLVAEGLVFIGLTIMLFIIEPIGVLIVLILVATLWFLFQKPMSRFLLKHGNLRQKYDGLHDLPILKKLIDWYQAGNNIQLFEEYSSFNYGGSNSEQAF
jgi:ABC-type multidrug transport system fused ATPase/permease subunit